MNQRVILFGGGGAILYADTWAYTDPQQSVKIMVPAGAQFTFNGVTYTGSQAIPIATGTYTLSANSPQASGAGTQFVFSNWSDGGAISHTVTVPAGGVSITGTFTTQYLLTTVASPLAAGTVSGGGYYDAGSTASPAAIANGGFLFANWSGACSGSGACSVTMNAPATVTGNFNAAQVQFTVNVPAAVQFTFNGTHYTGTQTIPAPPGTYSLATTTPQATAAGMQLAFVSWSDGGAITHTVTLSGVAQSITGTFTTQYLLTTSALPANEGVVAPLSGGPYYDAGTLVNVGSVANAGFQFEYWTGACAGSASVCPVLMNAPQTVVGNFTLTPKWIQFGPATMPQGRYGAAMAFDANRAEVVLFSGGLQEANGQYGNETWIWDGVNWSRRSPAASPSSRYASAMAYDVTRQQVVMFGGQDASTIFGDTWVWDGAAATWTQKHPSHSPGARSGASMAWDGSRLILFGGYVGAADTAETWAWDGSDWTLLPAGGGPPAREFAMMTFDPVRHQAVLFGGQTPGAAAFLGDTWTWDGSAWTRRLPATSPAARSAAAMAWHDAIQQVALFSGHTVVFGADTWLWDGTNWRQHAEPLDPGLQWGSAAAWDGARQQLVLLSHYASDREGMWIYANNAVQQFYTLTTSASQAAGGTVSPATRRWQAGLVVLVAASPAPGLEFQGWSGACAGSQIFCYVNVNGNLSATGNFGYPMSWLQLNPATSAMARVSLQLQNPISMAFDAARQQMVYFGGPLGSQTWVWNGNTWTRRTPAHSPTARSGHAMAYDAARQRVILFGGANGTVALNDTWAWDGTDWTLVDPGNGPAKRFNHALAFDRARQEILLFGGIDENFNFYQDTWVWNGTQWMQRLPAQSPPVRSDFGMAYDPVNAEVVISSGYEGRNDTWGWNGSVWHQRTPSHNPPALPNHFKQMAYDEKLQRAVMLIDNFPSAPQTWVWDGADWTQLSPTQNPTPRAAGGIVYDGVRQQILLFGGDNGAVGLNDTWALAPPTAILRLASVSAAKNAAGTTL